MKSQTTREDYKSKDETIPDLNVSREDLQRLVDTLTSQVADKKKKGYSIHSMFEISSTS